jgi:hypothetical protein
MKTRFTDLHARTALGIQLVPSIIENIAPYLSPPPSTESMDPTLIIYIGIEKYIFKQYIQYLQIQISSLHRKYIRSFLSILLHISYSIRNLGFVVLNLQKSMDTSLPGVQNALPFVRSF